MGTVNQFKGRLLPHINMGWYLCYVREMEADWDANDLRGLYSQVNSQIQLTLDAAVASVTQGTPDDQEMEGEFSSYWLPDKKVCAYQRFDVRAQPQIAETKYWCLEKSIQSTWSNSMQTAGQVECKRVVK